MRGCKQILVVDANENVLIRLERVLEDAGFETTTTWDPQEAMCFLHAVAFDLLLIGDHPPEVNARELLKAISALQPTPCCIVLQSSESTNSAEYIQLGASAVTCRDRTDDVLRAVCEQVGEFALARAA